MKLLILLPLLLLVGCYDHVYETPKGVISIDEKNRSAAEAFYLKAIEVNKHNGSSMEQTHSRAQEITLQVYGTVTFGPANIIVPKP